MSNRIVCPGCSCLCDGLTRPDKSGMPVESSRCPVGAAWFQTRIEHSATEQQTPMQIDSTIEEVYQSLCRSNAPLISGLENLTTQAQQAAVEVADRFQATIDSGWRNDRGSMQAFQRYGKVTATAGEIASRSDLVLLWFCDVQTTHPQFVERFVRNRKYPRKRLIVIDETETRTASIADEFIKVSPDQAVEFVRRLRLELSRSNDEPTTGLIQQLATATYGTVIPGKPLGTDSDFDVSTDQWFQLVRSLNDHTRFVMSSLPDGRNAVGANGVMTSISGFPDAVRYTDAGPTYNGLEFATFNIVQRKECDLLIVCDVGENTPFDSRISAETKCWLSTIPVVVISDLPADTYEVMCRHVPVGTPGWSDRGDFVRFDGIPIPLEAISGTGPLSAESLFRRLLEKSLATGTSARP